MIPGKLKWWAVGAGGLAVLALGIRIGRPDPPAPPPPEPKAAEHVPAPPEQPNAELLIAVQAALDQNAALIRLISARPAGQDGSGARSAAQADQMTAILLGLLNAERERRGEAPVSSTATPAEVAAALTAQGGAVLPERVVTAPCATKGRMHGIIPAAGAEWELLSEWDPCPPAVERRPWLDFSSGTLYSLKLAGAAWGNANLSRADELAYSTLSLDSTRVGWYAGGDIEHVWMSRTGKFWHGFGLEGGYQHSTAGSGWTTRLYYKPSIFVSSRERKP